MVISPFPLQVSVFLEGLKNLQIAVLLLALIFTKLRALHGC